MNQYLTKDQVRTIIDNAPENVKPDDVVNGLVARGYKLEGLNETPTVKAEANVPIDSPDYASRVGSQYSKAGKDIIAGVKKGAEDIQNGDVFGGIRAGLRTVGGVAGAAFAPLTAALEPVVKPLLDKIAANPETQHLVQPIAEFANKHPEAAKDLQNIFDIATLGAGSTVEKPIVDTAKGAVDAVGKALTTSAETTAKTAAKDTSFIRDLITPELNTKNSINAIKTGKVAESTGLTGTRDITSTIPGFENIEKAVSEVPGVLKTNTALQNNNAIKSEIGNLAESLQSQIKDKGFFSPNEFKGFMKEAKNTLADEPLLVGDAEKVANNYLLQFDKLVKKHGYTPEGILKARKEFDSLLPDKQLSPELENAQSMATRVIRQGANEFLAQRVPDVAVKELLAKQSNLFRAIENIAPKAAKEGGTKLKRFIKNNPRKIKAAETALKFTGGGLIAKELLD